MDEREGSYPYVGADLENRMWQKVEKTTEFAEKMKKIQKEARAVLRKA